MNLANMQCMTVPKDNVDSEKMQFLPVCSDTK